ncbi:MAG: type II toxin-antitoxin system RelE/ParE family toxin [Desulfomonilaceae bacterium]
MPKYSILIKPSAVKEIESVGTKRDRQRIIALIRKLGDDPRPPGCEKLSVHDKYRIRQGPYRIVYSIKDREFVVYVVKIGHRREVYR